MFLDFPVKGLLVTILFNFHTEATTLLEFQLCFVLTNEFIFIFVIVDWFKSHKTTRFVNSSFVQPLIPRCYHLLTLFYVENPLFVVWRTPQNYMSLLAALATLQNWLRPPPLSSPPPRAFSFVYTFVCPAFSMLTNKTRAPRVSRSRLKWELLNKLFKVSTHTHTHLRFVWARERASLTSSFRPNVSIFMFVTNEILYIAV